MISKESPGIPIVIITIAIIRSTKMSVHVDFCCRRSAGTNKRDLIANITKPWAIPLMRPYFEFIVVKIAYLILSSRTTSNRSYVYTCSVFDKK